ncbi:MAG TPA: hypothetical protein VGM27_05230 [Acidobacteriaceae bacterium]
MNLNTVQEIERAIDALTPPQREELDQWLDQHYPQPIDEQLKADLDAGRIDNRINRALADHKAEKPNRFRGTGAVVPRACGSRKRSACDLGQSDGLTQACMFKAVPD